jgi:pyridoxal phosphate enzyme (YggS family)
MTDLASRLQSVRSSIADECRRLERVEPKLIVVTKNHPVQLVNDLYELGERNFGENRVQEALPKSLSFNEANPGATVQWHLIGQLQTNKVKQALEFANSIHSLDRQSLLSELIKRTADRSEPLEVFIQINLTDDPERGGVEPTDLLNFADRMVSAPNLHLAGVMAVAGLDVEPARDFERVARLSEQLISQHPGAVGRSIGMSGDFLEALTFGATHLRIGTAITGNRYN